MIQIQEFTEKHFKSLIPLLDQLGYPTTEEDLRRRYKQCQAKGEIGVRISVMDEKVIGFVAWSRVPLLISDKMRYHIDALGVDEAYRGKGIGKALLQYVEQQAERDRPAFLDLISGQHRAAKGTHAFYKKLGFHNEGPTGKIYLRKDLY